MTVFGIDLSHWNTVNDWQAVRNNNISFASIKITNSTGGTDAMAAKHVDGARSVNISVGGYHFAENASVAKQVKNFAGRLKALKLDHDDSFMPMLDMEDLSLHGNANDFIHEFISGFREESGIGRIFVYANLDWFTHILKPEKWIDDQVLLWIARYNGQPGKPGFSHANLALHQHTSKGRVPGIPKNVDRDATMSDFTLAQLLIG